MSMAYNLSDRTISEVQYMFSTTNDRWFIPTTGYGDNPDAGTTTQQHLFQVSAPRLQIEWLSETYHHFTINLLAFCLSLAKTNTITRFRKLKKVLAASSFAFTLISMTLAAEAAPKTKRNLIYTQSYTYSFEGDSNVLNCVARASAILAKHNLATSIGTSINKGEQFGIAYGWSKNGTETAEVSCNRTQKLSILSYATYTKKELDTVWERWKLLKNSKW